MKRSSQIALVIMGVVSTTATASYFARRTDPACDPKAQQAAPPGAAKPVCAQSSSSSRSYRSHSVFPSHWFSSEPATSTSATRTNLAPSAGLAGRGPAAAGGGITARGGFGGSGHASAGG